MKINRIIETAIYCDDVDEMLEFYQRIFNLKLLLNSSPRAVFLKCGEGVLIIFNRTMTSKKGQLVPHHGITGAQHFAFDINDTEYDAWKAKLMEEGVEIEKEFTWPSDRNNAARSIYFRDPSGNSVELVEGKIWNE
jgi:catechol 2,3-dioxygenase-like lactoylglutathione lyase family enzyme